MKRFASLFAAASILATGLAAVLVTGAGNAAAASGLPTLTIALNGKTVVVGGSTVSGAVNVQTTVTNESAGSPLLFRLTNGVSPSAFPQAVKAVGAHRGDLNYLDPYGSIVFDGASPKGTSSAQTELPAGTYFAIDAQSSQGVPPHTLFTVAPSTSPASLPKPQATIGTIEFGFTGPTTLHDGELVRFENDGFVVHMDVWESAKSMKVAKQAVKLLLAGQDNKAGKMLGSSGGFANPMSTGGIVQLVINEKPGIYVQDCFMDTQDGREHTQLGMERIIKIVK
jgi:hypothetical protein